MCWKCGNKKQTVYLLNRFLWLFLAYYLDSAKPFGRLQFMKLEVWLEMTDRPAWGRCRGGFGQSRCWETSPCSAPSKTSNRRSECSKHNDLPKASSPPSNTQSWRMRTATKHWTSCRKQSWPKSSSRPSTSSWPVRAAKAGALAGRPSRLKWQSHWPAQSV